MRDEVFFEAAKRRNHDLNLGNVHCVGLQGFCVLDIGSSSVYTWYGEGGEPSLVSYLVRASLYPLIINIRQHTKFQEQL